MLGEPGLDMVRFGWLVIKPARNDAMESTGSALTMLSKVVALGRCAIPSLGISILNSAGMANGRMCGGKTSIARIILCFRPSGDILSLLDAGGRGAGDALALLFLRV